MGKPLDVIVVGAGWSELVSVCQILAWQNFADESLTHSEGQGSWVLPSQMHVQHAEQGRS